MRGLLLGLTLGVVCAGVSAQAIFTCVDAKGRRLTADRPIFDCMDRDQKELNPSGSVKGKLGPSLTAEERAADEDRAQKALEERIAANNDKRRARALLTRYPNQASHDKERLSAIASVDGVIAASNTRSVELAAERKRHDAEAEFFVSNPAKMPLRLKQSIDENDQMLATQKRFVAEQADEKHRIKTRFDDELVQLQRLWAYQAMPVTAIQPVTAGKKNHSPAVKP